MPHEAYIVRVSETALREMVLCTLETYRLTEGSRRKKASIQTGIEVFGHIWGFHRQVEEELVFYVESVSPSLAAQGNNSSVTPHPETLRLKKAVVERWSPHLTLIGDFHSHPYDSFSKVSEIKGWQFSDQDFKSLLADDEIWSSAGNSPLMLVMTICEMDRVREGTFLPQSNNVVRFDIGEFRFWLGASVGYLEDNGGDLVRKSTQNRNPPVHLSVFSVAYNASGDRLV